MFLNRLVLKNFKKYKNFEIEFKEGLTGIIGKNGSGKSTIFEGILFALYGELKTKNFKEVIRHSYSDENVEVILEFEYQGEEYKIKRNLRGKALNHKAELYKSDELIATQKEVTQEIIRLIKINKLAFIHTLFASQKDLANLSELNIDERKKMIRKLLGLESVDLVQKEIKEKIKLLKQEINTFNDILMSEDIKKENLEKVKNLKDNICNLNLKIDIKKLKTFDTKLADLKKVILEFDEIKQKKQLQQNEIKLKNNNISNLTQQIKSLQEELDVLKNKKLDNNIEQNYLSIKNKLNDYQFKKEQFLKKEGLLKEQNILRKRYLEIKKEMSNLEIEGLDELEKKITLLQTNQKELEIEVDKINSKIGGEKKQIKDNEIKLKNILKLGKNSLCPVCNRELLEVYDSVVNGMELIIENSNKNIKEYNKTLLNLKQNKQNIENDLAKLNIQFTTIKNNQKTYSHLEKQLNEIKNQGEENNIEIKKLGEIEYSSKLHKNIEKEFQQIEMEYKQFLKLQTELKRIPILSQNIEQLSQNIASLQEELTNIKFIEYDENKHNNLKIEYDEIQSKKDNLQKEINSYNLEIAKLQGEVNIIQDRLDENEKHHQKVVLKQKDLVDYEKLNVYINQFKTNLNSSIAPRISKEASTLFSQITKGKYQHIEVDENFNFFIYDDGKYPLSRFSGGEVDLANLVLRIAISKTLIELNGGSGIEFLAFDEIFGSQDESRRIEILNAFHTIKEQYRQIFLISHEMEIKEMFENVIEV